MRRPEDEEIAYGYGRSPEGKQFLRNATIAYLDILRERDQTEGLTTLAKKVALTSIESDFEQTEAQLRRWLYKEKANLWQGDPARNNAVFDAVERYIQREPKVATLLEGYASKIRHAAIGDAFSQFFHGVLSSSERARLVQKLVPWEGVLQIVPLAVNKREPVAFPRLILNMPSVAEPRMLTWDFKIRPDRAQHYDFSGGGFFYLADNATMVRLLGSRDYRGVRLMETYTPYHGNQTFGERSVWSVPGEDRPAGPVNVWEYIGTRLYSGTGAPQILKGNIGQYYVTIDKMDPGTTKFAYRYFSRLTGRLPL